MPIRKRSEGKEQARNSHVRMLVRLFVEKDYAIFLKLVILVLRHIWLLVATD